MLVKPSAQMAVEQFVPEKVKVELVPVIADVPAETSVESTATSSAL